MKLVVFVGRYSNFVFKRKLLKFVDRGLTFLVRKVKTDNNIITGGNNYKIHIIKKKNNNLLRKFKKIGRQKIRLKMNNKTI